LLGLDIFHRNKTTPGFKELTFLSGQWELRYTITKQCDDTINVYLQVKMGVWRTENLSLLRGRRRRHFPTEQGQEKNSLVRVH
jgi:hypothetical protein